MEKRIALITGASRGIGAATAMRLALDGCFVCLNFHRGKDEAEEVASSIRQSGGQCATFCADVSCEDDVVGMLNDIQSRYGHVSYLVNNAGYVPACGPLEEMSCDEFHKVFAVNVFGVFFAIKHAVGHMKHLGQGAIVNVSSEAATYGGNRITAYAASKGAINSLTKGLARELAPFHIRVNAVSPGVIDAGANRQETESRREEMARSIPLGRMGTPEEVARAISWLLSDLSSYVSGAIVPVAGAR